MNSLRQMCIVGPLPPPAGGMANQTEKLAELLRGEGVQVHIIQTNPAYSPIWLGQLPVLRAVGRLLQYCLTLQQQLTPGVQLLHIMANSGWSWHLFAAPAIWIAKAKGIPVVLNYRGGYADEFFARSWRQVNWSLKHCAKVLVPSTFLQQVFAKYQLNAEIVPNVLDTALFQRKSDPITPTEAPHLIVTRNLEAIYDVATAIKAFALVQQQWPAARLTIAGTGPELGMLQQLVATLQLKQVSFCGRLNPTAMAELYQQADIMLNASLVDNTPNSLIEAMAVGVPIVSTNSGGIPQLVTDQLDAILVAPGQPVLMADAIKALLTTPEQMQALRRAGFINVARFSWPNVWALLQQHYQHLGRS